MSFLNCCLCLVVDWYSSSGIAAGSTAVTMMSAKAIAAGGGVAAGGIVAMLQSIGAFGLGASKFAAAVTGAINGAITMALWYHSLSSALNVSY